MTKLNSYCPQERCKPLRTRASPSWRKHHEMKWSMIPVLPEAPFWRARRERGRFRHDRNGCFAPRGGAKVRREGLWLLGLLAERRDHLRVAVCNILGDARQYSRRSDGTATVQPGARCRRNDAPAPE